MQRLPGCSRETCGHCQREAGSDGSLRLARGRDFVRSAGVKSAPKRCVDRRNAKVEGSTACEPGCPLDRCKFLPQPVDENRRLLGGEECCAGGHGVVTKERQELLLFTICSIDSPLLCPRQGMNSNKIEESILRV